METLGSVVSENLSEMIRFPPEGIFTHVVTKSRNFSCALICVAAGNGIDPHETSGEACIQVLRGSGVLSSEGRECPLEAGTIVCLPEHTPHAIAAEEDLAFLFCLGHLISPEMYRIIRA